MIDYLEAGGPVYAEGCDIGYSNATTDIWPYFGASYLADGNAVGNVSSLTGRPGTFAAGLRFGYPYGQGPDSYVDELGATTGQLLLGDQSSIGRAVVRQSLTYRSVVAATIAGALLPTDRGEFISACARYLVEGLGIASNQPAARPLRAVIPISVVAAGSEVRLLAPAAAGQLYDATGRVVGTIRAGTTTIATQGLPNGAYLALFGRTTLRFVVVK